MKQKYKVQIEYKIGVTPFPVNFEVKPSKILKVVIKELKINNIKLEDLASIHIERV